MSRVRVGIFGMKRGQKFISILRNNFFNIDIVAVCDTNVKDYIIQPNNANGYMEQPSSFTEFDEFIKEDFDVVFLLNSAHQHAPFAVKALRAGKHVISECVACVNLKEAVELIEAVEETGKEYILLDQTTYKETFDYFKTFMTAEEIVSCESENSYNTLHYRNSLINNDVNHWRNHVASTTYTTHELGAVINFLKKRPLFVSATEFGYCAEQVAQGKLGAPASVITIKFEDGTIVKHTHLTGSLAPYNKISQARYTHKDGRTWLVTGDRIKEYNGDNVSLVYLTESGTDSAWDAHIKCINLFINKIQGIEKDYSALHDVYEAVDITLPGILGFKSITQNGAEIEIPNLRDKAVRDLYRNDTTCTFPDVAGDMYISAGIMRNDNKDYVE